MADEAFVIGRWVGRLDQKVEELLEAVETDQIQRADRALDTLRSWMAVLETMILDAHDPDSEMDAFGRYAVRLSLIDARLKSIQWLIEHKRKPWYQRYLPWLSWIVEFVLDRFGLGPFLPRLPRGR